MTSESSEIDTLRTANQRLEGEVARLREALETISAMFPAGITKQGFRLNGQTVTADDDDEFFSCKKVEAWAAPLKSTIDAALRGNGGE
jgi:DNA-binding winged helix-turn-helix (wHTH) protein